MTKHAFNFARAVVLAIYASATADIQSRTLPTEVSAELRFRSGQELRCVVIAWSGDGFEGGCGTRYWEDLTSKNALALLRECVGTKKDAAAAADAAAIVWSLPDATQEGKLVSEWAKRKGATVPQLEAARKEAESLKAKRIERARLSDSAKLAGLSPEAAAFPTTAWVGLTAAEFATVSAEMLEAARTALSKAGSSGTLHETSDIALLAESGDDGLRDIAVHLQTLVDRWKAVLTEAGLAPTLQGRIPVIIVSDRDRWRLLVAAAAGRDSQQYPEVITIYTSLTPSAPPRAMVLVAPSSDQLMQRYCASVGVARAILHYCQTPVRPPAWLNEGLPRVMAEVATPLAGMDETLRGPALRALRNGGRFDSIVAASYSDARWTKDAALSQSLAYVLTRWMYERHPRALFQFAKGAVGNDPPEVRFRKRFGVTIEAATQEALRWFQVND